MKNVLLSALLCLLAWVPGRAQSATEVRPVGEFHAISVGSGIELDLLAGSTQRVAVTADNADDRARIQTTVEDGTLTIRYRNPNPIEKGQHISHRLHVAVTAQGLTALSAGSGSTVTNGTNVAAATAFELKVSSGATVKAAFTTTALTVHQSSGSTVKLHGRATTLNVSAGSGASFDGKDLSTDRCEAQASSGASVAVAVREALTADAGTGASITYSGSPTVTKHTSLGGSVSRR